VAIQKFHGHERVEKVRDTARVEAEFAAEFRAGETALAELREDAQLDGGEEDFRVPEGEGRLEDGRRIDRRAHGAERSFSPRRETSRNGPHGGRLTEDLGERRLSTI